MSGYTVFQWLFFFYVYCIVGWIWESSFCSVRARRFTNRGFMKGPVIPIYGSGAVVMIVAAAPFTDNPVLTFISGMILASILEYVTGAVMEAVFKVKYWDYSKQKFNIQGYICLGASIGWGFATILMTNIVQKPVEKLSLMMPGTVLKVLVIVFSVLFIFDFMISLRAALDMRDILIKMEELKAEAARLQKRFDVVLAVVNDEKQQGMEKVQERLEDMVAVLESRMTFIEEKVYAAKEKLSLPEGLKEELSDLKAKALSITEFRSKLSGISKISSIRRFLSRMTIKGNPYLSSSKFKDSLDELKSRIRSVRE